MPSTPLSAARPLDSGSRGLYVIVDWDASEARQLDWFEVARGALHGGARILQLRAKGRGDSLVLEALERLRELVPRNGDCLLFANDRPDLAELAGADGVHLGQDDLPAADVHQHYPGLLLGLSTHDPAQFTAALELPLAYVALGPIFATTSKKDPEPVVGLETLAACAEQAHEAARALVAIGGIDAHNLAQVAGVAPLAAVISAVLPGPSYSPVAAQVERLTRELVDRF